jgi:hypothetical protein
MLLCLDLPAMPFWALGTRSTAMALERLGH